MAGQNYFIGVDIGGTFTDVVLAEATSHRLFTAKTLTTPESPGQGVIAAMRDALTQARAQPADIQRVVHATTLATNLILERKGSKVAFITTKGFGDLFVIGKERVVGADRYESVFGKITAAGRKAIDSGSRGANQSARGRDGALQSARGGRRAPAAGPRRPASGGDLLSPLLCQSGA